MPSRYPLAVILVLAGAVGCAHSRMIPGTTVPDTEENRAVLNAVEEYRQRLVAKNIEGLLLLASDRYFEDSGTPRADDDYGYEGLKHVLQTRLSRVQSLRYEIQYRTVRGTGGKANGGGKAEVEVYINGSFELAAETGERYRRVNDYHRFVLERNVNDKWKFLSGM